MDARSLELLELPAVRARVVAATSFAGGADLAERMRPAAEPGAVARSAAETEEAIVLATAGIGGPRGAHDLRERLGAAARGAMLEPVELHDLSATLEVALGLRDQVGEQRDAAPGLAALFGALDVGALNALGSELARSVGAGGEILDTASPELATVRRRLAAARASAERLIGDLARRNAEHLQERFTTSRAGRPVLAVKASARRAVPGLVHDRSASGETLFIEPLELVEQNNLASELAAQERDEIERVVAALSVRAGGLAESLGDMTAALATLDFALARAEVSRAWSGCRVTPSAAVGLEAARHPLLEERSAVPIEVSFGELRALVVSGPNTGGKTVALKTLGLFALLHQCGMRVPARRAELPVFDAVLADIGDEQSIARSLSTFSGHVARLREITERAGEGSLVLLDEVAAGTDPVEGSALARAVLEALVEAGARVVATTHHAEVKDWAATREGVANAAVGVDPESLDPTYQLRVGEPGASHALTVAERLGLAERVVARARALLAPARRETERLLEDAERARADAVKERERAEQARAEVDGLRRRAEERSEELDERIAKVRRAADAERRDARREVERELAEATEALARLREEISAARKLERRRGTRRGAEVPERDRRLGEADEAAAAARRALDAAAAARPASSWRPRQGDRVIDTALGMRGTLVGIEGDTAVLQAERGGRMRLPLARLAPDGSPAPAPPPPVPTPRPLPPTGTTEIDLRGRRADDARAATRDHVDRAALDGVARVRVIHGKGTGALRAAVREEMERHPLVERVEIAPPGEGGDGATLVYLDAEASSA